MSDIQKIEALHNYIINNTKYDKQKVDTEYSPYDSSRIQGVLFDNYAICSGYTDTMAVLLNKLGIINYKISSDTHVWNAVLLDGKWYHLDLTWDDPVTSNKKDVLQHEYFILTTEELLSKEVKEHKFDRNIYLEFRTQ
jgi:transglutaminase/protease-like cytokinesis protein 3